MILKNRKGSLRPVNKHHSNIPIST